MEKSPATGKFIELSTPAGPIKTHYHEAGGGGQCVLLVQTGGAATSAFMSWYLNMPAFAQAGYHVYAPDVIGFGLTDSVPGLSAAEFLLAFMDALAITGAHMVGNSMGSMAITRLAIDHPQRITSLILTGGEPRIETEESRAIAATLGRTERMNFVREMLNKPEVTFEDMRKATADFFYNPTHPRVEEVAEMRLGTIKRPGVLEREREAAFRQIQGGRSNYQPSDLAGIQVPTYLIHGRDEQFFYPEHVRPILLECALKVSLVIPDCNCTVLSHCGHWPQIEKAETFNTLALEFLRSLSEDNH
jgi:pimeloyl-ACP methyl ester carboxylesterase